MLKCEGNKADRTNFSSTTAYFLGDTCLALHSSFVCCCVSNPPPSLSVSPWQSTTIWCMRVHIKIYWRIFPRSLALCLHLLLWELGYVCVCTHLMWHWPELITSKKIKYASKIACACANFISLLILSKCLTQLALNPTHSSVWCGQCNFQFSKKKRSVKINLTKIE